MAEGLQESKVVANIPFLFYDVIGRMFPGSMLLIGGCISCWDFLPSYPGNWSDGLRFAKDATGLVAVAAGLGVLLFGAVASFLGFTLAALSNVAVEKIWRIKHGYTFEGLEKFLGVESIDSLKERFRKQFGSYPKDKALNESSFLCAYFGWKVDPTLGAMQGRWDADLLAAQSFVLVSLILLLMTGTEIHISGCDLFKIVWTVFLAVTLLGSFLNFRYHREKRVYGRFALFLALYEEPPVPGARTNR